MYAQILDREVAAADSVSIPDSGDANSDSIDVSTRSVVGVYILSDPEAVTDIEVQRPGTTTWYDVYDQAGTQQQLPDTGAAAYISLDPAIYAGCKTIRFSQASNPSSAVSYVVVTRGVA